MFSELSDGSLSTRVNNPWVILRPRPPHEAEPWLAPLVQFEWPNYEFRFGSAVQGLLALADRYYCAGDDGLSQLPWRCSVAIEAARRIYAEIGSVLVERGCDLGAGGAIVSPRRKLELVGYCLLRQVKALPARSR